MKSQTTFFSTFAFIFLAFIFLFAESCGSEKPGEGKLAESGKTLGNNVVKALEKYHDDNKDFPMSLQNLVPKYLDKLPQDKDLKFNYSYKNVEKSYVLEFEYSGSGMGIYECDYTPETKKWICTGKG